MSTPTSKGKLFNQKNQNHDTYQKTIVSRANQETLFYQDFLLLVMGVFATCITEVNENTLRSSPCLLPFENRERTQFVF